VAKVTKDTYRALKHALENRQLMAELRQLDPSLEAQIAGYLLSQWFPVGNGRRLLMAAIAITAVGGALAGHFWLLWLMLLLPFFSPRLVGETVIFLRRLF